MWRDVAESLRSQPGRVGLSFLSVMVGIVVLTLLLSMLLGLRHEARQLIRQFGANVMALAPDSGFINNRGYAGLNDLSHLLKNNLPFTRTGVMVKIQERATAWEHAPVWAVDAALPEVRGWAIKEGRSFDVADGEQAARLALITDSLAVRLGLRVGDECSIGSYAFRVIGILRDGAGVPDATGLRSTVSGEPLVLILHSVAERLAYSAEASSSAVFLRVGDGQELAAVQRRAQQLLSDPRWTGWGMTWMTPDSLIRGIRDLQRLITLTAGSVAVLCLVLGGTTLMSLMLADVRQRVPEIGLRRALGATRRDVANLFVIESCVITGAAALGGIVIARLLLGILSGRVTMPLSLDYFTFVIPVIVSIVLGCVFSFWPAQMAARLSPAQALRNA